ncbi:hypothetical protein [Adhaeribacter terreus]|uniref:Short-chain dehydrogenase n=1 Tax=Adhaeribacter terreus TaxID=529703 RepID=A0ABW0E7X1_9BACT
MDNKTLKIEDLFLKMPLYDKLELNSALEYKLVDILRFSGKIDMFCVGCNKESTFTGFDNLTDYVPGVAYTSNSSKLMERVFTLPKYFSHKKVFTVKLKCSRNENHLMLFNFYIKDNILIKIGQYPSLMDLAHHSLKKYKRILGTDLYNEFNRAVGLATLNIGLGSFIYLKRIFDHLLEDAHKQIFADEKWNELEYLASPMHKRIALLKHHLPPYLVEKRDMFQILSKDVHELSEEECLKFFPLLQNAIECILDEKLIEITRDLKRQELDKSIDQLTAKKNPAKKK